MVQRGAYLEDRRGDLLSSALAMLENLGTDNCCLSIIMTVVHTLAAYGHGTGNVSCVTEVNRSGGGFYGFQVIPRGMLPANCIP